jgi:DNA-binding NarL/FixJ family response regulator
VSTDQQIADSSAVARFLRDWERTLDPQKGGVVFTARERALVELLAAGHTDASAARRLGVSPRTVSYTLQSLMDRLEVENRFQLGLALGTLGAKDVPDPTTDPDPPPNSTADE